jgi:hypothetical protein
MGKRNKKSKSRNKKHNKQYKPSIVSQSTPIAPVKVLKPTGLYMAKDWLLMGKPDGSMTELSINTVVQLITEPREWAKQFADRFTAGVLVSVKSGDQMGTEGYLIDRKELKPFQIVGGPS